MRLTAYTNYALRTLVYCALHPDETVRVEDVARAYSISRAHLLKAARQLGQHGFLENIRGRTGGIRLGMTPEDIRVGDVVRITEGDLELVECFNSETNSCPLIGVCRLSALFRRGLDAFLVELDKVTLADLTGNAPVLLDRLESFAAQTDG
ncbi:RrF2 family transcriptional regulator [Parvularcula marina]|uniref:Rrf2 family transcriptional regulator n=1 Tax=Parvularcula marina TaxID=2292771 RepID=A0A371REL9_9PROT|nr:Rrf2 family transcriptional regulator [Parvularcula marina]